LLNAESLNKFYEGSIPRFGDIFAFFAKNILAATKKLPQKRSKEAPHVDAITIRIQRGVNNLVAFQYFSF